jgi:glucuronate isomerase
VGQDSRQKLTIFGHDDGLDISISDQFVQDPKVLLLEVQVLGDLKELLFTKVDNG